MIQLLEIIDLHKHFLVPGQNRFKQFFDPKILFSRYRTLPDPEMFGAVNGVSFSIDEGECVGLVGESGSGKSTLLRMIARLLDITSGQIRFRTKDISLISSSQFTRWPQRSKIQVVFQDPSDSLNPTFTAFKSIADPLKCLMKEKNQSVIRKKSL